MARLASIGSVVRVGDRRYVVAGHRMTRSGFDVGMGYVLVPYPLGFTDANSISLVPVDAVHQIVTEGFANKAGIAHLAQLEELAQASEGISYEDYEASVRLLHYFAQEGGSDA